MVFSSTVFLFGFLPLVLLGSFCLRGRARMAFLLAADLVFYGWGEPVYILLMLGMTLFSWLCGMRIAKTRESRPGAARLALAVCVAASLGCLGFFKYAGLFTRTWNAVSFLPRVPEMRVLLPIGISFYTFQTMSYAVDVYRGDAPVQRSLLRYGVYVTLFPQLIAGPIVRYKDIDDQLDGHRPDIAQVSRGVLRFVRGLSKKVLLANRMGFLWDLLRGNPEYGALAAWAGILAYSLQIYFDFSGYSDMACGLGDMLGFRFMENFDHPYISRSVTEFWRRWHISLGTWFRDYVYIPLGGNRRGTARTWLNLLIVWALTGFWHGAGWNFLLWGLYYFVILAVEKAFLLKRLRKAPAGVGIAYTLVLVVLGWVLFYFDTGLGDCGAFLARLFGGGYGLLSADGANIVLRGLPLGLIACFAATPAWNLLLKKAGEKRAAWVRIVLCAIGFLLCAAALAAQSYNPFLYFQF